MYRHAHCAPRRPTFPETCLPPDSPGYGQIAKPGAGKRRTRRHAPAEMALDARHEALQEAMRAAIDRPDDHVPPVPDMQAVPTFVDQARELVQIYREATAGRGPSR